MHLLYWLYLCKERTGGLNTDILNKNECHYHKAPVKIDLTNEFKDNEEHTQWSVYILCVHEKEVMRLYEHVCAWMNVQWRFVDCV